MNTLRQHFPWMTAEEESWIRTELLRRAAVRFEKAAMWRDAAECWLRLGELRRAGELYSRADAHHLAAQTFLAAGCYAEALELYLAWEASLTAGDWVNHIKVLLGQAACHWLGSPAASESAYKQSGLSRQTGRATYRRARTLLEIESEGENLVAARCWVALGEYGVWLARYDLVQEGYERALACYEETVAQSEKIGTCQAYLATVRAAGDRLLTNALEERLAGWGVWEEKVELLTWQRQQEIIESHSFRESVQDVLHFTHLMQWKAWRELAAMEDNLVVDDYLRSLAPPNMIYIPPGSFLMGSTDEDLDAAANEKPQHEVWLGGYYIDRYPVTNAQFRAFIKGGGYEREAYWIEAVAAGRWADGAYIDYLGRKHRQPRLWESSLTDKQPVVGISWYEAMAFARWAEKSLPSEAEWEKAAGWDPITGHKRLYPWGDDWDETKRVYDPDNWPEVGQISPSKFNAYGLSDMAGLSTWCRNKFQSYPYQRDDDHEEDEIGTEMRVFRGGGSEKMYARCEHRFKVNPWIASFDVGLRCTVPHTFSRS